MFIKTGKAKTRVTSATFEPIASPKDKIGVFSRAEVTATTTSGSDVATETSKKLIVYPDTPNFLAIFEEDSINRLTAKTSVIDPASIKTRLATRGIII